MSPYNRIVTFQISRHFPLNHVYIEEGYSLPETNSGIFCLKLGKILPVNCIPCNRFASWWFQNLMYTCMFTLCTMVQGWVFMIQRWLRLRPGEKGCDFTLVAADFVCCCLAVSWQAHKLTLVAERVFLAT